MGRVVQNESVPLKLRYSVYLDLPSVYNCCLLVGFFG